MLRDGHRCTARYSDRGPSNSGAGPRCILVRGHDPAGEHLALVAAEGEERRPLRWNARCLCCRRALEERKAHLELKARGFLK